jgi:hypothetical protein
LRGFFFAACLLAAIPPASECARATEARARPMQSVTGTAKVDPSFRLLALGGRNVRWTMPAGGLPATVTYAFVSDAMTFPGARNCDAMGKPEAALARSHIPFEAFRGEVRAAFDAWQAAANIQFRETSSPANAGILIGSDAKARGRAFTNVALRDDAGPAGRASVGAIRQSLICLNPEKPWKIGFDGNLDVYDLRYTIMHEIGHAIGLDHPSPEGRLMSFRYVETARGLTSGDAAGAVALYGRKGVAPIQATAGPLPIAPEPSTFGLGDTGSADRRR